jgi:hypothetical protein
LDSSCVHETQPSFYNPRLLVISLVFFVKFVKIIMTAIGSTIMVSAFFVLRWKKLKKSEKARKNKTARLLKKIK